MTVMGAFVNVLEKGADYRGRIPSALLGLGQVS